MSKLRHRRKLRSGHRVFDEVVKHWLGEGSDGQESLLLDLDPYLFAADAVLCRAASTVAHRYDGDEKRPLAMLIPPRGTVSWHIGYLAKKFDLCLWIFEQDEIIEEAAEYFNASIFTGELPDGVAGTIDFLLLTEYSWNSVIEFSGAIRTAGSLLSDSGISCAVLRCWGDNDCPTINWGDGGRSGLRELILGDIFHLPSPDGYTMISLPDVDPSQGHGVTDFLKRHRPFFGKNARELFFERMRDPDFCQFFSAGEDNRHAVAVLNWEAKAVSSLSGR